MKSYWGVDHGEDVSKAVNPSLKNLGLKKIPQKLVKEDAFHTQVNRGYKTGNFGDKAKYASNRMQLMYANGRKAKWGPGDRLSDELQSVKNEMKAIGAKPPRRNRKLP